MAANQSEPASAAGSGSAGPKRSRARSWGRGFVWVIAVYWSGVGMLAALFTKSGLNLFQTELMTLPHGAVLL
jgi:CHASE2 domain-containing sensor protein